MLRTRVPYFGHTSIRTHPLICFRPGRQNSLRLIPMHNGGLITPVQKPRHRLLVRACGHIAPHALLIVPSCHGPECTTVLPTPLLCCTWLPVIVADTELEANPKVASRWRDNRRATNIPPAKYAAVQNGGSQTPGLSVNQNVLLLSPSAWRGMHFSLSELRIALRHSRTTNSPSAPRRG
jgi:hypothetical protein